MSTPTLPFLPGYTFNNNFGINNFPLVSKFESINGVRMTKDVIVPTLPGKINERYPSLYSRGEVSDLPSWIAYGKETLAFDCFYQETVHEMHNVNYQIHKCKLYFFLEDGTLKVIEPKIQNSCTPQGKIITRQRVRLPEPKSEYFFDIIDFNVGKEVNLLGKHFKLTNCDKFTRIFIERLGIPVPDPIPIPDDPFITEREQAKLRFQPKKPNHNKGNFKNFLEFDRKVLRFYGFWDDRNTGGNLHDLTIHFYLADDTMELIENSKESCGKNSTSLFIKRGKIPKFFNSLPGPGHFDESTILNVLGPNLTEGRYVIDPLNCGKNNEKYYETKDLGIGAALNIYGRKIFLTDCDPFTKEYYRSKYGIDNLTPVEKPKEEPIVESVPLNQRKLPPWNGYGSFEDSAQSCRTVDLKPIHKDYQKFIRLDSEAGNSRIMRFVALMRSKRPEHCGRKFIIKYHLADNAISILEIGQTSKATDGCPFLRREPVKLPGQEIFTPEPPDYYLPQHMFIGANIILNSFNFILVDADQYTLRYMELHCDEFPKSDINIILKKVKEKLRPVYKNFVETMLPKDQPILTYDALRDYLNKIMGEDWCEHEMVTLARNFSGVCRTERHSREFIRKVVHFQLKKWLWDDLERFKEYFHSWDTEKTGYLPMKEVTTLIKTCKLPLEKETIEQIIKVLAKNDKCEISGEDLFQFLDISNCPVAPIIPINIKRELYWSSELDPVPGRIIDWCSFNKALDMEDVFKEPIKLDK